MHYKAMGDLTHTGSLTDRIHKFLVSEYGSFYEAMRDLRNSSASFVALDYGVLTKQPAYSLDFINEYYRAAGVKSNLNPAITHAATSNATMTGSDGNIKWRPHNLLPYSEDFSNSDWGKTDCSVTSNATTAPDGTTTADKLSFATTNNSFHFVNVSVTMGAKSHTVSAFFKAGELTSASIFISRGGNVGGSFNLSTGVATASGTGNTANMVDVGNGWYHCSVTNDGSTDIDNSIRLGIGNGALSSFVGVVGQGIYAWGAHLFRSDLGGMVDNPAQSTGLETYVPTTSSAVYLPRVGHHIYNGDAWVNEGVLHESEARTNLVTYSEDFTNASWARVNSTPTLDAVGPDGVANSAVTFSDDSSGGTAGSVLRDSLNATANTVHCASIFAKADQLDWLAISGQGFTPTVGRYAYFNLATGVLGTIDPVYNATIEDFGNGWYRCSVSFDPLTDTNGNISFYLASSDGNISVPINGTSSILIYGAQFEVGATPSSYIPTSGSTVTRAAETLTVPAANLPYSSTNMSIQIDGRMAYADRNLIREVQFVEWLVDSNNGIEQFACSSTGFFPNGAVAFFQEVGGVSDSKITAGSTYPFGINVPFNVASRHGSTFINGAVDGTALTANTTPIALPDLSATDLQLGYDFMGTIGKFRVWSDDLTDTGIEEASAPTFTDEFAMTVTTTTANETFTIPAASFGTFDAGIEWGDGSVSSISAYNDANLTHTYATAGDHLIRIRGSFPNIRFNNSGDKLKVKSVENLGTVGWINFYGAFYGCTNMTSFTAGTTDTSSVTTMGLMFYNCNSLTSLDVSNFDTSSVTDMNSMFRQCTSLTSLDVSNLDTSSVTAMVTMFYNCNSLTSLDVSNFDTSSVTSMNSMFQSCSSLTSLDVSNFDTSSVVFMYSMFRQCTSLTSLDLSSFDTSSITNMGNMFVSCSNLTSVDVSSFDTSSATNMGGMFYNCSNLTSLDVSSFDTSSVIDMNTMFRNCSSLTSLDVSNLDTSSATNMGAMFQNCSNLTSLDVSNFDTSSATNMSSMFYNCINLTDIVGVENFNIEGLNSTGDLNNFIIGGSIPTSRYDALLVNWDAQEPFDGMAPKFGSSTYTAGSAAATARANLISNDGWTITDGGTA